MSNRSLPPLTPQRTWCVRQSVSTIINSRQTGLSPPRTSTVGLKGLSSCGAVRAIRARKFPDQRIDLPFASSARSTLSRSLAFSNSSRRSERRRR